MKIEKPGVGRPPLGPANIFITKKDFPQKMLQSLQKNSLDREKKKRKKKDSPIKFFSSFHGNGDTTRIGRVI